MVERINVNGTDIDLNTDSGLSICIKSNLLKPVSEFSCCYSYTYSVPLTKKNRAVLGELLSVGNRNKRVRMKLPASYYRDELKIFEGTCYVNDADTEKASLVFLFGINNAFQQLKDDDININELFNNPKEVGVKDYTTDETLNWRFTVPIATYGSLAQAPLINPKSTELFFGKYIYASTMNKATVLPSVNVSAIMGLLKKRYGIEVESGVNTEGLWVMCDSLARRDKFKLVLHGIRTVPYYANGEGGLAYFGHLNADYYEDTENNFKALFPEIDYGGRATINVPNPPVDDSQFCNFANIKCKYIVDRVKIRAGGANAQIVNIIYTSTGSYTIETLEAKTVAKIETYGGTTTAEFSPNDLCMQKEYEAGTGPVIRVIPNGIQGSNFSMLDFHVEFECRLSQEGASLGWFNSIDCLPNMKVVDFLQNVYFGAGGEYFVNSLKGGKKVKSVSIDNLGDPYDWSDKLIGGVKQYYKIDGLARKNLINYAKGDKEETKNEVVATEDNTLADEGTLFESAFGFYDAPNIWSHATDLSKLKPSPKLIGVHPVEAYVLVNDEGVYRLAKTYNSNMTWFDNNETYKHTLKEPLRMECNVHITSTDLANLDLTRPVHFSQFGALFLIEEINVTGEQGKVKLIQLKK